MKPLAIDLFCGLGGWTDGLLSEGWDVIGFDIERHEYGDAKYPAQLVLQSVLTLHGSQFKDAALIVASPPCQAYSYMAMPWTRAKAIAAEYRGGVRDVKELTALFDACFRIQREASEAAGRHIPMVVENVRGAIPWVGRSRAAYGSFHLWGDAPALMPMTKAMPKVTGYVEKRNGHRHTKHLTNQAEHTKNSGGSWFAIANNTASGHSKNPVHALAAEGIKQAGISGMRENGKGDKWFQDGAARHGSRSKARKARKAASALIAKIPFALSSHIAQVYKPRLAVAA